MCQPAPARPIARPVVLHNCFFFRGVELCSLFRDRHCALLDQKRKRVEKSHSGSHTLTISYASQRASRLSNAAPKTIDNQNETLATDNTLDCHGGKTCSLLLVASEAVSGSARQHVSLMVITGFFNDETFVTWCSEQGAGLGVSLWNSTHQFLASPFVQNVSKRSAAHDFDWRVLTASLAAFEEQHECTRSCGRA